MTDRGWWGPASVLGIGAVLATVVVQAQHALPLRVPLDQAVSRSIAGYRSVDVRLSAGEERAAAVTAYLARNYVSADSAEPAFALYVGYYAQQTQGQTIHSPKNCLPGSGWEPLASVAQAVVTPSGTVTVNRYLLQNGVHRAVVFYWYQGRGRVAWNEYAVKWDLLRDAALRRRSDEALVRIVVPVRRSEAEAVTLATQVARRVVESLVPALPAGR